MRSVWVLLSSIGIALQVLVIGVMLRGWARRFRVLFAYVIVLFLTTVIDGAAFYSPALYARTVTNYWVTDAVRQALIFLMVLSFIGQALDSSGQAAAFRRVLWAGAAAFVAVSLYATRDLGFNSWMTSFSRNLGFLAVILNLVLWVALLRQRHRERILLAVTGGMGIQMAGKAIGHSLRQLAPKTPVTGDLVLVLSHLLCLYIWWSAFRRIDPAADSRIE